MMAHDQTSDHPPSASKWQIEIPNENDDAGYGGCRSIEAHYDKGKQIGKGTYGEVYVGTQKDSGARVALKKIRMENEKEGFPITALREIKLLKRLNQENVICLKEIVRSRAHEVNHMKGSIYMVFDYMDHDMTGLMERMRYKMGAPQAKCYIMQLLKGLNFCHSSRILHRDLKLSNLLVNNSGNLKIADFGLARIKDLDNERPDMTNKVITLWYRPPELLLGSALYGPEIDIWSVGCIIAEILTGKPLFNAESEAEQLDKICKVMGPLNESTMPGCSKLPLFHMAKQDYPKNHLKATLAGRKLNSQAIDLLTKLLALDPIKRIDAMTAYGHPYFYEDPQPAERSSLPTYEPSHEKDMKDLRDARKQAPGQSSGHKRDHSQMEGAYYPDSAHSSRMQAEGYGPPGYIRPLPAHMASGMNGVAGGHPAGSMYARPVDAGYGQHRQDPYSIRPQLPRGGDGAYRGPLQRPPPMAHASHHNPGNQHRQEYNSRAPHFGEQPSFMTRKR